MNRLQKTGFTSQQRAYVSMSVMAGDERVEDMKCSGVTNYGKPDILRLTVTILRPVL